jgi:hypothetical protein
MYNPDTEILFPLRVLPQLRGLRGEEWGRLVDQVSSPQASRVEKCAIVLMMVRMGGCVSCNSDSFRAMRGCTVCARQTVRRFKGTDHELTEQHSQYKKELEQFLKKQTATQSE